MTHIYGVLQQLIETHYIFYFINYYMFLYFYSRNSAIDGST
jgi:hypothetical protein